MLQLRDEVTIRTEPDGIYLRDCVTGLEIALDEVTRAEFDAMLQHADPELAAILTEATFLESLDDADLRLSAQRAFRRDLHRQEVESQILAFVDRARMAVPYYRSNTARYDISRVSDFGHLPLLDKGEFRKHFHQILSDEVDVPALLARGDAELVATSGTTASRVQALTFYDIERLPKRFDEIWNLGTLNDPVRTAVLTSPACTSRQCNSRTLPYAQRIRDGATLFLDMRADPFTMGRHDVEQLSLELWEFRPDLLLVNPVYAHCLIRAAREYGVTLPPPRLVLSSYQYPSRIQRRALSAFFGAPVRSYYSATELGGCPIAVECGDGHLHVCEDQVYVETVDLNGAVVGGLGRIAVTNLGNPAVPLIRYLIGDAAVLSDAGTDCMLSDWRTLELAGRVADLIRVDNQWITTRQIDDVLSLASGIDFYSCVQDTATTLRVEVVPTSDESVNLVEISERLRDEFRVANVSVVLRRRLDPEASQKYCLSKCLIDFGGFP